MVVNVWDDGSIRPTSVKRMGFGGAPYIHFPKGLTLIFTYNKPETTIKLAPYESCGIDRPKELDKP